MRKHVVSGRSKRSYRQTRATERGSISLRPVKQQAEKKKPGLIDQAFSYMEGTFKKSYRLLPQD